MHNVFGESNVALQWKYNWFNVIGIQQEMFSAIFILTMLKLIEG